MAQVSLQHTLLDETFDTHNTEGYKLLIAPSLRGIHCLFYEPARSVCLGSLFVPAYKRGNEIWSDSLSLLLQEYPWLTQSFQSVHIVYSTPTYTVVPRHILHTQNAKALLQITVGRMEELATLFTMPINNQLAMVYAVPGDLVQVYNQQFPQAQYQHPQAALAAYLLHSGKGKQSILLDLQPHLLTLIALHENTLHTLVSHPLRENLGVLYHLTALFNSLSWNREDTSFFLTGQCEPLHAPSKKRHKNANPTLSTQGIKETLATYYPLASRMQLPDIHHSYLLEPEQYGYFALQCCLLV